MTGDDKWGITVGTNVQNWFDNSAVIKLSLSSRREENVNKS